MKKKLRELETLIDNYKNMLAAQALVLKAKGELERAEVQLVEATKKLTDNQISMEMEIE